MLFLVMTGAVAALWNIAVGISLQPSIYVCLVIPGVGLGIAGLLAVRWPKSVAAEGFYYISLWLASPVVGVFLTYLFFTIDRPLYDALFYDVDQVLGLDWMRWARFTFEYPWFAVAQQIAYSSFVWQPILVVAILAWQRPRFGNAELLNAFWISLLITVVVAGLYPSISAFDYLKLPAPTAPVVHALRTSPAAEPIPYAGIIAFPSFHATMGVLFAYACRHVRWIFIPSALLNGLLIVSAVVIGGHYFIDVPAGIAVATVGLMAARRLRRRTERLCR